LVTGNGNGTAGIGYGKAEEVALATEYAFRDAKKHLGNINSHTLTNTNQHKTHIHPNSNNLSISTQNDPTKN
jgi:ribosomal protein S5